MYTFNNQESQKKPVGYTKTKLGLDTKFELGISSNTFRASEGWPKSHLATRSPRLLPASTRVSCLCSLLLAHQACPAPAHPAWLALALASRSRACSPRPARARAAVAAC
jgi:hypothetical protein